MASGTVEDRIHRKMTYYRVPLMLVAVLALVAFIHRIDAFWWGAPVCLFGELIQMWAASHLHKDERLTVSGPYSHVRNPMYLGRFFLGLGLLIMTWNPWLVGVYVVGFAVYAHLRVRREEARLIEIFGEDYQRYCRETHRWLPGFRAYSGSEARGASWRQVCANHEQINMIGLIIVLVALYLRIERIPWHW